MDARRVLVLLVLGACAGEGAACSGSLASEPMRMSGVGGTTGDTGAGTGGAIRDAGAASGGSTGATDARVKADSQCLYDVDAVPASVDGGVDPCAFLIEYPADPNLDAFRIIVDGVRLQSDPTNGWTYTDITQTVFRIAGPTCDAIKAGAVQTIWIEFYCYGIA